MLNTLKRVSEINCFHVVMLSNVCVTRGNSTRNRLFGLPCSASSSARAAFACLLDRLDPNTSCNPTSERIRKRHDQRQ